MAWRVAKSLLAIRDQVNAKFPDRDKDWDGTIGDAAHASRNSDHNPWIKDGSTGIVSAMDITHDPSSGMDSYKMAEQLRLGQDDRIKYVISNRKIFSSTTSPWKWRKYSGSSPHDHHVHISVKSQKVFYDDTAPWEIPMLGKVPSERPEVAEIDQEVGDDEPAIGRGVGIAEIAEGVGSVAGTVGTVTSQVKPLFKSRISVGAVALGASSTATVAAAAPPSLWDQFIQIWKSPFLWLVLLNVGLTIFIVWHYYFDHGAGALKKQQE